MQFWVFMFMDFRMFHGTKTPLTILYIICSMMGPKTRPSSKCPAESICSPKWSRSSRCIPIAVSKAPVTNTRTQRSLRLFGKHKFPVSMTIEGSKMTITPCITLHLTKLKCTCFNMSQQIKSSVRPFVPWSIPKISQSCHKLFQKGKSTAPARTDSFPSPCLHARKPQHALPAWPDNPDFILYQSVYSV